MPMKMLAWLVMLLVGLSACANQAENKHFYSYVDETGRVHTVETEQKAKPKPQSTPKAEPVIQAKAPSDTPFGPFGRLSEGAEHSQTANYSIVGEASRAPEKEVEALLEEEDERFVVFPGADGQLVRQRYDANEVKAYEKAARDARAEVKDYQWVSDTYVEATVEIDADCCQHLLPKAAELDAKGTTDVAFSQTQFQRLSLAAGSPSWPVRIYKLPQDIGAVVVKSYKKKKQYLHPQLLLLDDTGTPVLQVSNVFSKRYPETWARHGYVEGALTMEPNFSYLLLYLGYEAGQYESLPFDVEEEHSLSLDGVVQLSILK